MRGLIKRSRYLSMAGMMTSALVLSSCSAPDRLSNDDISLDETKAIVKERLISPIEDERIVEFNKKLPRRSILQVIHAADSLSDPTFLQLIESKLSDEINFLAAQDDAAGFEPASIAAPTELTQAQKDAITAERQDARRQILFKEGLSLEASLFTSLSQIEENADTLFLETIPLERNQGTFPSSIGANATTDNKGFLSFPADLHFIGGENSNFTSKTSMLLSFIDDRKISLNIRELPVQDALAIISTSLGIEHTLSPAVQGNETKLSLSIQAGALSILDAVLTQNDLALLFDSSNNIARYYSDTELLVIDAEVKEAIRGHNELLLAKRKYERAENDMRQVKKMITLSQMLLAGNSKGFAEGVAAFPRGTMGEVARKAIMTLTEREAALAMTLKRFDEQSIALIEPTSQQAAMNTRNKSYGKSLSDILVQDACITRGNEIFVEKIAIYNASAADAKTHVEGYFAANAPSDSAQATPADAAPEEANTEEAGADAEQPAANAVTEALASSVTNAVTNTLNTSDCPDYAINFVEDSTGLIVTGRRQDNSLALRILEEFDVPKLQVLIEIFMVTVSRNFSREISNLITAASGGVGGNNIAEAALTAGNTANVITTPLGNVPAESLAGIRDAVDGGYTVRLRSPKTDSDGNSLIASALSFIESNQLGRVLSSPTILVEDGVPEAKIERKQVAKVEYQIPGSTETDEDGNEVTTPATQEISDETANFSLTLRDIDVFPANRTVQMKVEIENKRFTVADINLITERDEADYTEDEIITQFTASPGDVIVLAGLSANSDGTTTSGLPGTTGGLAPVSPLLGGSDAISSNLNEMIIFMAPTVIDPSSEFQPHSAFGNDKVKKLSGDAGE